MLWAYVGMLWAAMPRAGQQWHVKLPIASLSKCLDWGAMPRPCQGKACQGTKCQGKACQAKACQGTKCQAKACQGTTCQGKTCQGKACQASNSLTFLKCLEWGNAKAKARQGMSRPRHAKAKARHANARQGKACQRKARQGMPRPCHAKLPIASLSRNALNGAMPRPRQGKARHVKAKACQASNRLSFSKCLEWGDAKALHANASQGHAMPSFQ